MEGQGNRETKRQRGKDTDKKRDIWIGQRNKETDGQKYRNTKVRVG
jgi:hypothetical protein